MPIKELAKKYKDLFLSEAKQNLASMNSALLKFEKQPQKLELINDIFRSAHTLKSMAATMEYYNMSNLCHGLEDILDAIKKQKIKGGKIIDLLFNSFDTLELALKEISKGKDETSIEAELIESLEKLKKFTISTDDKQQMSNDKQLTTTYETIVPKVQTIEVKVERLDLLVNLAEELLINKMRFDKVKELVQNPELTASVDSLGRLISELQYNVMQARLVPVGFIFDRFPRMVRDLAKDEKKLVNLIIEGSDIELDRQVIDEIGESLVHLLRNAVDHGIETPEERKKQGKKEEATIKLSASSQKGLSIITVEDDGRGINFELVKAAAIKTGILPQNPPLEEVKEALFLGISTSKGVTSISGRGLGLNIVKNKVDSLGGTIRIESQPNVGTKFEIEIPLTLAIIKTLFVKVAEQTYAIPLINIERLTDATKEQIKGMFGYESIIFEEEDIPLIKLSELFKLPSKAQEKESIVIVRRQEERFGLVVDSLLTTHEIVLKPLNKMIRENKYFAGSSIIGSGEVILVIDIANLSLPKKIKVEALKGGL